MDFPVQGGITKVVAGGITYTAGSAFNMTTVNAHATDDNVKGTPVAIGTATYNATGIILTMLPGSTSYSWLVDLSLDSGAAYVILSNFLVDVPTAIGTVRVFIPISIPAGATVYCRCQCSAANKAISAAISFLSGDFAGLSPYTKIETLGAGVDSSSGGTKLDPGGTAYIKSGYVQIGSASTIAAKHLIISCGARRAALASGRFGFDLAIGETGAQQVFLANILFYPHTLRLIDLVGFGISANFPAGTKFWANPVCTVTTTPGRQFDMVIYLVG